MKRLRGLFTIVSLLAILHLAAVVGLAGVLWARGTLNPQRVEQIAAVLRGEYDTPSEPAVPEGEAQPDEAQNAKATLAGEQTEDELASRRLERERAELQQRLDLVFQEMTRVRQERERLEQERQALAEATRKRSEQETRGGFQKQLELFSKIKPAEAMEYLLGRDVDEAARLLAALNARKGKKIIEAVKTPAQRRKMDRILRRLGGEGPTGLAAKQPGT